MRQSNYCLLFTKNTSWYGAVIRQSRSKTACRGFESFCPCQNESTSFDVLFILQKKKESKATVKKTVLWTVFRESADASFLSYLCATSVVGTFARLIVFCPCQTKHLKNGLGMRFLGVFSFI